MQNASNSVLQGWSHFGGHRAPVLVQKMIHRLAQLRVAVEQVVQLDVRIAHVEVHEQIADAQMLIATDVDDAGLDGDA